MRCVLGRLAFACALSLVFALTCSASVFAGVTQQVAYCGDPVDNPDCNTTGVWAFSGLRALAVEHSLVETGTFVWFANQRSGAGHPVAGTPLGDPAGDPNVAREINTSYTDPAGDMSQELYGIAYDWPSNTLFFADSGQNRIVAFMRGQFGAEFDQPVDFAHPGCFPSDCSTSSGGDSAHLDGPIGLDFDSTRNILWVADAQNLRVQGLSFTAGTPDAADPQLAYSKTITRPDWTSPAVGPSGIAVDQHSGHVFVAAKSHAVIQEFDADGTYLKDLSSTSPPGSYTSVTADSLNGVLYASKSDFIDAWSISSGQYLGGFDGENFLHTESIGIAAIASDAAAHALYVMTDINYDSSTNPPAVGYTLSDAPTCTVAPPVTVTVGQTVQLPISCVEADGDVQELHRTPNEPALGTLTPNAERTAISYTAGFVPGSDTAQYSSLSKHGRSGTYSQPVTVVAGELPPPVVRETANLQLDSGDVYVKLPGSNEYVKLTADMQIPIGTIIDARAGKAHLTMGNDDGTTSDGVFWDGIFQVLQGSGKKPITTMKLRDDLVPAANASVARAALAAGDPFEGVRIAKKRGKKKNGLWGNAKGKYKTSGKGGSATVRGTIWYVADYQCGSLFKVKRGKVLIDPAKGKNFYLKTGKQRFLYFKKCAR